MFDVGEAKRSLTTSQRNRLIEIARAEKALPWDPIDYDLQERKLVGRMTDALGAPLANISDNGWSVLRLIAARK